MRLLILRRCAGFNGGVLKTLDYFAHARAAGFVTPRMMLFPLRAWDDILEDRVLPHEVVTEAGDPDVVLLSREWDEADRLGLTAKKRPILHLVQHAAHGIGDTAENASLARPATRIVVAQTLGDRIRQFNPNGKIVVIEAGVSVDRAPLPWSGRRWDVAISGYKNPAVAEAVAKALIQSGRTVQMLTSYIPRQQYLDYVAASRVLVALPLQAGEAAYLSALEAMHLDVAVVTPDAGGPRGYCIDGVSCLTPQYSADEIARRANDLLSNPALLSNLRTGGASMAAKLTVAAEREKFIQVLQDLVANLSPVNGP